MRWRERSEADIPAATLRKLDLLWNGALVLTAANPIFATYLQARHMLGALRAGEPSRLASTLSLGAVYESLGGTREYEHGLKLLNLARQLAERLDDSYLSALAYLGCATVDLVCGRIEDGLAHCRSAAVGLQQVHRRARAWELGSSNMLLIWFLGWGGRVRELSKKLPLILEDARARGDVYADVFVRCCCTSHLVELAADNPERAIAETARTIKQWRKTRYDMQHFGATFGSMECHLYAGRAEKARQVLLADWAAIRHSLIFRKSQIYRVILYYARGRTALAGWLGRPDAGELRVETEQFARQLAKLRSPWGDALSSLLRAGVVAGLGRRTDALVLLQGAEEILRKQDLRLLAAAASRRRGELEGKAGAGRVEAADAFMKSENILRPDRLTAMMLPGDWL